MQGVKKFFGMQKVILFLVNEPPNAVLRYFQFSATSNFYRPTKTFPNAFVLSVSMGF